MIEYDRAGMESMRDSGSTVVVVQHSITITTNAPTEERRAQCAYATTAPSNKLQVEYKRTGSNSALALIRSSSRSNNTNKSKRERSTNTSGASLNVEKGRSRNESKRKSRATPSDEQYPHRSCG
jgi:hypothetical protein